MATVLRERYALHRVIGRGASGCVWAAEDIKLGRRVAIKQLDRQFAEDSEACSRFEREAWMVAQLRSPHVVQVFDYGVDGEGPFIVMEHLRGESLDERLTRGHPESRLPLRMATTIIAEVARGLTASHQAGIVHRDLKPGNVFLAVEERRQVTKLLDFGIARAVTEGSEQLGRMLAGTPQFMSPEHFEGQGLDARADLWSLGVMAYQMLTGHLPFRGETLRELRAQILAGSLVAPSELVPELEPGVDDVFQRALSRAPDERFPTAAEFAIALEQFAIERTRLPVARVLFVDDEEDTEPAMRLSLEDEVGSGKYELLFARSGDEGLELLSARPDIDVVFADIRMPRKDAAESRGSSKHRSDIGREGLSFLAQVSQLNPIVRVVMLSAYHTNQEYVRMAMNHGAFDFLPKPTRNLDDLRNTIDKCAVEARKLRQLLESHQENEVLRALIGRSAADRLVAEVRAADAAVAQTVTASIAFLWVPDASKHAHPEGAQRLFATLNTHYDLFVPEVHAQQGIVHEFAGDCLIALFQGRHHANRAVGACVSILERVRMANAMSTGGPFRYSVAAAVASGSILDGRLGSTRVGRIERCLMGQPLTEAGWLRALCQPFEILVSAAIEGELTRDFRCETDADRKMPDGGSVCRIAGRVSARSGELAPNEQTQSLAGR